MKHKCAVQVCRCRYRSVGAGTGVQMQVPVCRCRYQFIGVGTGVPSKCWPPALPTCGEKPLTADTRGSSSGYGSHTHGKVQSWERRRTGSGAGTSVKIQD